MSTSPPLDAASGSTARSAGTPVRCRSLADDLRARSAQQLGDLLRVRTDLLLPSPESLSELARRAGSTASIRIALQRLDARTLAVAQAIADEPVTTDPDLLEQRLSLRGAAAAQVVEQACAELHRLGLLWSDGRCYRAVRELAPTVRAVAPADPALALGPAVLPRPGRSYDPGTVDRMAGERATVALAEFTSVMEGLQASTLSVTRDNVVASRDFVGAAGALGLTEPQLAMWLELGWLAGLIGVDPATASVLPTEHAMELLDEQRGQLWAELIGAWWHSDRDWGAFADAELRPHVFGEDHICSPLLGVRREWAMLLADSQPGSTLENPEELLVDRSPLVWSGGMRGRLGQLLTQTSAEAELLGFTARGSLSSIGRSLLTDPDDPGAEDGQRRVDIALSMLPATVDRVLVQGDHTVIAPGPLAPGLARSVARFATLESSGAASVYRLTPESIAQGLQNMSAEQMLDLLREHSDRPVPQSVDYLIRDTAARHGRVRVGAARSFVCTEDAAAAELVLAALGAGGAHVERISDTVLVSAAAPEVLASAVRAAGVPVVSESAGVEQTAGTAPPPRPPAPVRGVSEQRIKATAELLVAAESAEAPGSEHAAPEVPRMHSAQVQAALSKAAAEGANVWLRYADNAGSTSLRLVSAVQLDAGALEAVDLGRNRMQRFAVSRIAGVAREGDQR